MAPMLAALMLPYSVVNCEPLSPTCWHMARRSFMSSSSSPWSSAILNTSCNTPAWVSLRFSMRASNKGPRSLTVARTGCPCSPNTSHRVTGKAVNSGVGRPRSLITLPNFSPRVPACEMPVRSPLTSAMNTGTPMRENASAMVCRVMVLPVPVAPVISPWRFARSGRRQHWMLSRRAITKGSVMKFPVKGCEVPKVQSAQ